MKIWDLDLKSGFSNQANQFVKKNGFDQNTNLKFKVGQTIQFWTGADSNIRTQAKIKGFNGDEIYVYNDCYWFPIFDNKKYAIKVVGAESEAV